jgi:enamine deaminase RidA (YjgF/YER057c/UK114 family)
VLGGDVEQLDDENSEQRRGEGRAQRARGRHARCAVGMGSLPFNMTVEIEAVAEVA